MMYAGYGFLEKKGECITFIYEGRESHNLGGNIIVCSMEKEVKVMYAEYTVRDMGLADF